MDFDRQGGARLGARRHFAREATIFRQGDVAHGWHEVVEGMARVCQFRSDGRRQVLAFAVPGDVIGLEHGRRDACAEALTPMTLVYHPFGADDARNGLPWGRVVRDNHHCLTLMGLPTAIERIAAFILSISRRLDGARAFDLPMPRVDIADHLGLTMHTVSRTLCDLARRGMLRIDAHHHFQLIDPTRLAAIAGIDPGELYFGEEQLVA